MEKAFVRTTSDSQVNIRSISYLSSRQRTEEKDVSASRLFEYLYGSPDILLIDFGKLNGLYHSCHTFGSYAGSSQRSGASTR